MARKTTPKSTKQAAAKPTTRKAASPISTRKSAKSQSASATRDLDTDSGYLSASVDRVSSAAKSARDFAADNATTRNAAIAAIGLGVIALFATKTGRGIVKSAGDVATSLINDFMQSADTTGVENQNRL